jgi:hypothetical protein
MDSFTFLPFFTFTFKQHIFPEGVRRIRSVWKQGRGRKRRWRKWHSKVLHNLHFSNNFSAEDISRKMRMVRLAEHMKNTYSILPYKFKGTKLGNTTT